MNRETPRKYDVEILTADGLWAQHGVKLTDRTTTLNTAINYRWHRWGTRTAAILLTLGLHALLVGTVLLGTRGRPPLKPLTEGAAASSQTEHAAEFVTVMLLLNDHSITPPEQSPDDSAYATPSNSAQPTKDAVLLANIDTPIMPEISGSDGGTDENAPSAEATGDEAGRAMLFGRYMGQVKARIERAWEQPMDSSIVHFDCKVQIKQNSHGEVQEVTLQRCNDDPAWQLSLVQAIQRASPLSAPPNESVFSDVITLSFAANRLLPDH